MLKSTNQALNQSNITSQNPQSAVCLLALVGLTHFPSGVP